MVEQAPSGVYLFFALAFFVAAVIVFFSAGEGVTPLSAVLGIAFVVLGGAFVGLAGYGGGEQAGNLPEAVARTGPETAAEETTSAPGGADRSQAESIAYENNYCIEKQFAEATRGMDSQQAIDYESGVIAEAVAWGVDPRTVLTERGLPC